MRVVVVGTGRCGTMTFSRACAHLTNFSVRHESTTGMTGPEALRLPERHIEVNPHLSRMLWPLAAQLDELGGDVLWVHLQRERQQVVRSWMRRGRRLGVGLWTPLVMRVSARALDDAAWAYACGLCYDAIVGDIEAFMRAPPIGRSMHLWLHRAQEDWWDFLRSIGAQGDLTASHAEWGVRHNASK